MKNTRSFLGQIARANVGLVAAAVTLWGCGQSTTALNGKDISGDVSESATATVGGAVASTNNDTVAQNDFEMKKGSFLKELENMFSPAIESWAFVMCPTVVGTASGCSASGDAITLTYPASGCTFDNSSAIWVGGSVLTAAPSSYAAQCGAGNYPYVNNNPVTSLTRTYLGSIPGGNATARTNRPGTVTVALDTTTATGWQYSVPGAGYTRSFVTQSGSGSSYQATHTLTIGINLQAFAGSAATGSPMYNHTLSTTNQAGTSDPLQISVSIASGAQNAKPENQIHTVSGSLNLQHNLAKYTATAVFTGVQHVYGCCYPVAGTIETTFSAGVNNGLSEKLDFSGGAACNLGTLGQVQFTNVNGATTTKTLTHCF